VPKGLKRLMPATRGAEVPEQAVKTLRS